jgi:MoaA/NifB/PqqE/SkfB family radical SAM enzyme
MSTEDFDSILYKVHKHIRRMQLSCAWEYSIAKNAPEIIRTMGKYKIPKTSIYTNGNILTDEIAEALVDAKINDFVVSIGEATKKTYERLRRGGNFEKVISNIKKLNGFKQERKSRFPRICANLTVVNSNIKELVDFVDIAHRIGIQAIRGRHLILNANLNMDDEKIKDNDYANQILCVAEKKSSDYGIHFSIPKYVDKPKKKKCRAPWEQLYISSDADVSVCPRIHMYEKLGNLLKDDFKDIIRGRVVTDLKDQFKKQSFNNPVCGICVDNLETEIEIDQGF